VRRFAGVVGMCGLSAVLVLSSAPAALAHGNGHGHDSSAEVLLAEGLSSPKGLAVNRDRNLVVAQGAFGPPGPVLEYDLRGRNKGTVTPLTEAFNLVDIAVSPRDGTGWAISSDPAGHLFHQLKDGTIVDVLDIPAYQATDPDPVDNEDIPTESNPYGLTVDRRGNALVADAAGNDVIRVTPDGVATTVARFDRETVATDHIPDFPGAPTMDAEAVPTTVTIGPDGAIYVGELKGFPFRPGSSNIWRIAPRAEGAWCSVNTPEKKGKCSLYASNYTAIQDIAFGSNGKMYVYELAAGGVLAFEAGLPSEENPTPEGPTPPAVLLESSKHRPWARQELAAGQLSQPGGVVVVNNNVYVTDGVFSTGRLLKIDN